MAKKKGRPKEVKIDLDLVKSLASIQCTKTEVSAVLDIPLSTLTSREDFSLAYKNGIENGKASLRRTQFKLAQTNAAMAIWLGKQYLDQKEKVEITNTELMKEEIELVPTNGQYRGDVKNRIQRFINNDTPKKI